MTVGQAAWGFPVNWTAVDLLAVTATCPEVFTTVQCASSESARRVIVLISEKKTTSCAFCNRLIGLVVEVFTLRVTDPGFDSCLCWDFSRSSHTSELKVGTWVATLQGAWHYRVSARCQYTVTGWDRKFVSLRYTCMLLLYATNRQVLHAKGRHDYTVRQICTFSDVNESEEFCFLLCIYSTESCFRWKRKSFDFMQYSPVIIFNSFRWV